MGRAPQIDEIGDGLRGLYAGVASEPIPVDMLAMLGGLGEVDAGTVGGKVPASLPFAGGELAAA
jgi:hypothetical protein